ncbi:MAG: UDP-N-acetylmuramate--L-alanine ligase [Myxococcales bacterium]
MKIYLLGIAGTGMGSFAGLLRAAGHEVSGSDENVYPPMSDKLAEWRIQTYTPYSAANLDKAKPDLAVVGNVIRAENPEAKAVRRKGVPHMSFPETLEELFLTTRHPVVVAGTHGKTTTTSILAAVLQHAGRDPSLLVGGVPLNFNEGFRLGKGEHFVIEGDEYDTAYFDKGPKFLHYRARTAIVTGAEFDHADIYRDTPHYESAFEKFYATLPADGYVAACSAFPNWKRLASFAKCKVETYRADTGGAGFARDGRRPEAGADGDEADWTARWVTLGPAGASFEVAFRGNVEIRVTLPAAGRHNVENALGVYAACRALGLKPDEIAAGFAAFKGVKRRQELRGEVKGVAVIDDFAHHPTAVRETIAAIVAQYPGRRIVAVFEPRSNTAMRKVHQDEYAHAFSGAAETIISQPTAISKVPESERVDARRMAEDIGRSGTKARWMEGPDAIVAALAKEARSGDVILAMSNGGFGGIHQKLLDALARQK